MILKVWSAVASEVERQHDGLELIASENYTSPAVMQAAGSVLTNKYAEGYPGRRYYGGCEFVDVVEDLARTRVKQLFGAEYANVQPHSGSQANMAIYLAALEPGDTVLGLDFAHGGHLTHGMKLNISGMLYNFVSYGVREDDHRLDFDQVAKLAKEHKPKLIVAGASAYPREIPHARFAEIAKEVGAKLMVDMAHYAGLVAAGLHDNPVGVGRLCDVDHPQNAAWSAGRSLLGQKRICQGDQQPRFPRFARRPVDACDCRQGGLLWRSAETRIQDLCSAGR